MACAAPNLNHARLLIAYKINFNPGCSIRSWPQSVRPLNKPSLHQSPVFSVHFPMNIAGKVPPWLPLFSVAWNLYLSSLLPASPLTLLCSSFHSWKVRFESRLLPGAFSHWLSHPPIAKQPSCSTPSFPFGKWVKLDMMFLVSIVYYIVPCIFHCTRSLCMSATVFYQLFTALFRIMRRMFQCSMKIGQV